MEQVTCPECQQSFPGNYTLSMHRQRIHAGQPNLRASVPIRRIHGATPAVAPKVWTSGEQESHELLAENAEDKEDESTLDGMRSELRGWGVALILIGIAQYFIPFLDPLWAFVVVPLGVLSLVLARRALFIAIGGTLVAVGLLNIFSGDVGGWTFYGLAQIVWGVQEIRRFERYAYVR